MLGGTAGTLGGATHWAVHFKILDLSGSTKGIFILNPYFLLSSFSFLLFVLFCFITSNLIEIISTIQPDWGRGSLCPGCGGAWPFASCLFLDSSWRWHDA